MFESVPSGEAVKPLTTCWARQLGHAAIWPSEFDNQHAMCITVNIPTTRRGRHGVVGDINHRTLCVEATGCSSSVLPHGLHWSCRKQCTLHVSFGMRMRTAMVETSPAHDRCEQSSSGQKHRMPIRMHVSIGCPNVNMLQQQWLHVPVCGDNSPGTAPAEASIQL